MFSWPILRILSNGARQISYGVVACNKNHYDSLGITPKSTQADVKDAYYKLSMLYHPDKNKNSEDAAEKFKSISEAYEILGNVRLRKMYDKGLIFANSAAIVDDEPVNKFYKSREQRSRPPPPNGKTPIYDFDEWSKSHYGSVFARDQMRKERRYQDRRERQDRVQDVKFERVLFAILALVVLSVIFSDGQENDRNTIHFIEGQAIYKKRD